ncbi:MAG: molybdopterin-dependent oxidoreductase [Proteobacteria bacterium]|nr:molybdopterin-dependent oxidoreductase [Pseudomonadota bacterium]
MKKRIFIGEETAKGYTRREFLKYLELAGISVTIGGAGFFAGCSNKVDSLAGAKEFITRCGLCGSDCGMKTYIKNDRIVAVVPNKDDPNSKGFMCDMGLANVEQTYSPDRILNPGKRVGDKWVDISWDEALNIISEKLSKLKIDYGPQSTVCHYGVTEVRAPFYRQLFRRFSNVYGTPNFTGCGSQCAVSTMMAKKYSIGSVHPDYENTKCMVQWGSNPSSSSLLEWFSKVLPARERGAKLICIDPRANPMTQMADIHLKPRPGTDGVLALAMTNIILGNNLYHTDIAEKYGVGFSEYEELVKKYKPELAETITGIPAKDIINATMMYAENSPACIETGNALELHINGVQTIRSVMLIQALCGNVNVKGGMISSGEKVRLTDMELDDYKPFTSKGYSADRYPVLWQSRKMVTANLLPDTVLTGKPYPVKALMVIGGNPIVTGPNSSHQRKAYKKMDLVVVYDLFMTETAKMADIFLPATSCLERDNIKIRDRIYISPKVIPEQGNAWPEWKLWFELAKKMGYEKEFPWATLDEAIDEHLSPINITAADLRENFNGIDHPLKSGNMKELEEKIKTPSGKIEFHSQTLADAGYNPLPDYVEPYEGPADKKLLAKYPLLMTSGIRIPYYIHSQFRNLASLKAKSPGPVIEMNPADASSLGISEGNNVSISSLRGSIQAKAQLNKSLKSGIVAMSHGWSKSNVNELTDDSAQSLDPISSFPGYRGFLCKVEKV